MQVNQTPRNFLGILCNFSNPAVVNRNPVANMLDVSGGQHT